MHYKVKLQCFLSSEVYLSQLSAGSIMELSDSSSRLRFKSELSSYQCLTCGCVAGTVPSRDLEQQSKSTVAGHNEFALTAFFSSCTRDELYTEGFRRL